jgi:hypothetical protein
MSPEFALTRVEAVGDDRLEVEGTWSGVRGVRFVRPALVVRDAGRDRTLLATLDHKPWPAEDGRPWKAAFPWHGDEPDVAALELAVTPSIVVPLGERAAGAEADRVREPERARPPEREREPERVAAPRAAPEVRARRITDPADERLARAREERDAARAERDAALAERDRLAAALRDARREIAARPARDAVRAELRQRDEALAARDAAPAERDAAVAERDRAVRERDALRRELDEREQAAQGAAARRQQALDERDAARAELEAAVRRAAASERERADARVEEVRRRLAEVEDERDRALAQPAGVAAPVPVRRVAREHEHESSRADWAARTAAILALVVLLVLFITFVKALG